MRVAMAEFLIPQYGPPRDPDAGHSCLPGTGRLARTFSFGPDLSATSVGEKGDTHQQSRQVAHFPAFMTCRGLPFRVWSLPGPASAPSPGPALTQTSPAKCRMTGRSCANHGNARPLWLVQQGLAGYRFSLNPCQSPYGLDIVILARPRHQRLGHETCVPADGRLDRIGHVRVLQQEPLGILAALTNTLAVIGEPCA